MTQGKIQKWEDYEQLISGISELLETARRASARAINAVLTAAYWEIGRRIVEFEQAGKTRAVYGEALLSRLSNDLIAKYGRGFSRQGLQKMRAFFLGWEICSTASGKLEARAKCSTSSDKSEEPKSQTVSAESSLPNIATCFPLPWSAYVRLLSVKSGNARRFYETEALRGGWSVRQLQES
jgi:hypothetical protein